MAEMTITEKFDRAKKLYDGGDYNIGYLTGNIQFPAYCTNKEWEQFKHEMHDTIRKQFDAGKGSEMREYTRDGRQYPPKMASYASSSRFMYEMGKDIPGFTFEKQLSTGLSGYPANLDGYLASKNLFVEAKCHEFYSSSKPELRAGHKALFDAIMTSLGGKFRYEAPEGIGGPISFEWDGEDCKSFDLKQMMCHLCGIANYVLDGGVEKVNFIYLIYKPVTELLNKIEKESDRDKVMKLFEEEKMTAERIEFKDIFYAVLSYFNTRKHHGYSDAELRNISNELNFQLCTQDNFRTVVENL